MAGPAPRTAIAAGAGALCLLMLLAALTGGARAALLYGLGAALLPVLVIAAGMRRGEWTPGSAGLLGLLLADLLLTTAYMLHPASLHSTLLGFPLRAVAMIVGLWWVPLMITAAAYAIYARDREG